MSDKQVVLVERTVYSLALTHDDGYREIWVFLNTKDLMQYLAEFIINDTEYDGLETIETLAKQNYHYVLEEFQAFKHRHPESLTDFFDDEQIIKIPIEIGTVTT